MRRFPNLSEVTLHGIGYFSPQAAYHMDKDLAQSIITAVLGTAKLRVLRLLSFSTLSRCLVLQSDTLEELHSEFGKHFEVGLLYLPRVRLLTMEPSCYSACFYHAQNGELKKIVAQGK